MQQPAGRVARGVGREARPAWPGLPLAQQWQAAETGAEGVAGRPGAVAGPMWRRGSSAGDGGSGGNRFGIALRSTIGTYCVACRVRETVGAGPPATPRPARARRRVRWAADAPIRRPARKAGPPGERRHGTSTARPAQRAEPRGGGAGVEGSGCAPRAAACVAAAARAALTAAALDSRLPPRAACRTADERALLARAGAQPRSVRRALCGTCGKARRERTEK